MANVHPLDLSPLYEKYQMVLIPFPFLALPSDKERAGWESCGCVRLHPVLLLGKLLLSRNSDYSTTFLSCCTSCSSQPGSHSINLCRPHCCRCLDVKHESKNLLHMSPGLYYNCRGSHTVCSTSLLYSNGGSPAQRGSDPGFGLEKHPKG